MEQKRRVAAWCSRLLLSTALLVGIVLMHVLGHPGEHAASHLSGGVPTAAHAAVVSPAVHPVSEPHHADGPAPSHGVGVAVVCLAVLGAGIATIVGFGLLARRRLEGDRALTPAPLPHVLRAIPPPGNPGALLSQLSLLRI